MQSGHTYWMKNSCMHMSMVSLSNALMGDFTISIPESSLILQITLRSELMQLNLYFKIADKFNSRVLLATIRNLGSFPCPRCLIAKARMPKVGTIVDDKQRENNKRVANDALFSNIELARTWIYNEGLGVKSAAVERLLSPTSQVPTVVCLNFFFSFI